MQVDGSLLVLPGCAAAAEQVELAAAPSAAAWCTAEQHDAADSPVHPLQGLLRHCRLRLDVTGHALRRCRNTDGLTILTMQLAVQGTWPFWSR